MSEDAVDLFDLDTDIDDVGDLVQYINPHDGTSIYGIAFAGQDKIGDKQGIRIIYQLIRTEEKSNPEEAEAPVGSVFQEAFTGNDMGKKLLKLRLKQFFGDEIKGAMRPYIETLNEKGRTEFMVQLTTKVKKTKNKDKDTGDVVVYDNVRILDASAIAPISLPDKFEWLEYSPTTE